MNFPLKRTAFAAALVFATPMMASAAFAQDAESDAAAEAVEEVAEAAAEEAAAPAEAAAAEPAAAPAPASEPEAAAEPEEEVVTCRYIRLDTSSRRKTRVCRTAEGWRQLNNRR